MTPIDKANERGNRIINITMKPRNALNPTWWRTGIKQVSFREKERKHEAATHIAQGWVEHLRTSQGVLQQDCVFCLYLNLSLDFVSAPVEWSMWLYIYVSRQNLPLFFILLSFLVLYFIIYFFAVFEKLSIRSSKLIELSYKFIYLFLILSKSQLQIY